jgi:hypothetical protein
MKGLKLIFISQINRDGSGTTPVNPDYIRTLEKDDFNLNCLSITENTYIAHGFNSYVVKLKNEKHWPFKLSNK